MQLHPFKWKMIQATHAVAYQYQYGVLVDQRQSVCSLGEGEPKATETYCLDNRRVLV